MTMTPEEFVRRLHGNLVEETMHALRAMLQKPAGRKPDDRQGEESNWFNNLSEIDQQYVLRVARRGVSLCCFGVLTLLDGADTIEDYGPKGKFLLIFDKDEKQILLNDPSNEPLHDIYGALFPSD